MSGPVSETRNTGLVSVPPSDGLLGTVRKMLRRRAFGTAGGSGDYADKCPCEMLLYRRETSGGPAKGVDARCVRCDRA